MNLKIVMGMHDDTPSGGRNILYTYANELVKRGDSVEIIFLADARFAKRKRNNLVSAKNFGRFLAFRGKQNRISWFTLSDNVKISTVFELSTHLFREGDNVLVTDFAIALSMAEKVPNYKNVKYFVQADDSAFYDSEIVKLAWKLPYPKIVVSSHLKTALSVYSSDIRLVKNFLDISNFYLTKSINRRAKAVSLLKHPSENKGYAFGVEVLKRVSAEIDDLRVIIFGKFDAPGALPFDYEYIHNPTPEVLRDFVYNESAIYLATSQKEGWGLTSTEAMAGGAALISTDNGGVEDFGQHGVTALLSSYGDVQMTSEQVIHLLKDTKLREQIATRGHNLVMTFTLENSVSELIKALR